MIAAPEAARTLAFPVTEPHEPEDRRRTPDARDWRRWAEGALLVLALGASAALELVGLDSEAFGNTYYAAAVKSMLASWHNLFFVSSDLGGFVWVDKPPLGLWIQALSAKLLGFNGVALLLPQALAGIACVALVYLLVRRSFGAIAGLLAAAVLAVTPITVITDRNNTMDATLVLVLLLAVWATSRAAETGRLRLLLLGAALVGLAFNIKMLQAYLVVPGLALTYLVCAPLNLRRKLTHLAAAAGVLLVVSLVWCVAVDLTPANLRPYVGSSGTNSTIALALTYNGLGRVTQTIAPWLAMLHISVPLDLDNMPGMAPGIGSPSVFRLFTPGVAGQASWLLPAALAGGAFALFQLFARRHLAEGHLRARSVALSIWLGWLLTCGAYFSFARFYHTYYLIMLGPAIAALGGIGLAELWRSYARSERLGWVLPLLITANAVLQIQFLTGSGTWQTRLEPWLLWATLGCAFGLVLTRWLRLAHAIAASALALGLVGLLLAPTMWSITSVQAGQGGAWLPSAGPTLSGRGFPGRFAPGGGGPPAGGGFARGGGAMTFAGPNWNSLDPALVQYLEDNQGSAKYLAATQSSSYASVLTLLTDEPVMALGGYQGWDQILTSDQLQALVQQREVRFFLLSGNSSVTGWVRNTCTLVPTSGSALQLYDCFTA